MKTVSCDLCGNNYSDQLFQDIDIVKCRECGLVYLKTHLSEEDLLQLYDENYYNSDDSADEGYDNYVLDQDKIVQTFDDRLEKIESILPGIGKVLDIGAATGYFLLAARKRGWIGEGVELSEYASEYARQHLGLDVHTGDLDSAELENKQFDLITMWDTIEHVPSPKKILSTCKVKLKPNGLLVLTTPDIGSLPSKIFKRKWMGIKPEEHLFYFDRVSINKVLQETGFQVDYIKSVGKMIDVDFFLKRIGHYSLLLERFFRIFIQGRMLRRNIYINPLDIIIVTARHSIPS